jgi:hypothetical protein
MLAELDSERFFFDSLNGNNFYFNSYSSRSALLILLHSYFFLELTECPLIAANDLNFGEILVSHSRMEFALYKPVTRIDAYSSEPIGWNIARFKPGQTMVNFFRYSDILELYKILFKIE